MRQLDEADVLDGLRALPFNERDELLCGFSEELTFYEIELLLRPIRLLCHPDLWQHWMGENEVFNRLLKLDDFTVQYAMGQAIAGRTVGNRAGHSPSPEQKKFRAHVHELLRTETDLETWEVGAYASKFVVMQVGPWNEACSEIESLADKLLGCGHYVGAMILGEALLDRACRESGTRKHHLRKAVPQEAFWDPVWDYLRLDVCALEALSHLRDPEDSPTAGCPGTQRELEVWKFLLERLQKLVGEGFPEEAPKLSRVFSRGPSAGRLPPDEIAAWKNYVDFALQPTSLREALDEFRDLDETTLRARRGDALRPPPMGRGRGGGDGRLDPGRLARFGPRP